MLQNNGINADVKMDRLISISYQFVLAGISLREQPDVKRLDKYGFVRSASTARPYPRRQASILA